MFIFKGLHECQRTAVWSCFPPCYFEGGSCYFSPMLLSFQPFLPLPFNHRVLSPGVRCEPLNLLILLGLWGINAGSQGFVASTLTC